MLLLLLRQQLFQFQQVPVGSASRLLVGNKAKKACNLTVSVSGSQTGPGSAKTDSFLCPPPTATSGVKAGTGAMQAGAPVVSAPGTLPESFLPEPEDVKIHECTMLLEQCRVSGFPGVQSSLRCWPGNGLQFHGSEFKGEFNLSEK